MIKYYPVELHTHTIASDGHFGYEELVAESLESGVKAIAITDHNTTSAANAVSEYGRDNNLIVVKGIEWTTFYGHIVVLGGKSTINWLDITKENIQENINKALEDGDIVVLAHPFRLGAPICNGCRNEFNVDFSSVSGIEIWSGYMPSIRKDNLKAVNLWSDLLYKNYKISALYGRDWHFKSKPNEIYAVTYVGVEDILTDRTIKEGISRGRTYISTGISMKANFYYKDKQYNIGDEIQLDNEEDFIAIEVKTGEFNENYTTSFNPTVTEIKIKGNVFSEESNFTFDDKYVKIKELKVKKGHIRIEIYGDIGKFYNVPLLYSSPIYLV